MTDLTDLLDQPWGISPAVALRPEPFGALAYHFGNRRLLFLKRQQLVDVVRRLDCSPDVRTALVSVGVPAQEWDAFTDALRSLAGADLIRLRTTGGTGR